MVAIKTKYRNRLKIDNDMRSEIFFFLHSATQPRLERLGNNKKKKKISINLPIKIICSFLCVCFGLEAVLAAFFQKRVDLSDIHQNIS